MPNNIPIPVLSTVTFKNFLTGASSVSNVTGTDNILLTDGSGNLKKINKNNFSVTGDVYQGVVSNYNSSTVSGYYKINSLQTTGGPNTWSSIGTFNPPGVLEVRTVPDNSGGNVVTQIATVPHAFSSKAKNGYFIRRFSISSEGTYTTIHNWKFTYEDISTSPTATTTAPGIMSTKQVEKLNNLTSYSVVTNSANGLMSSSMLANLEAATAHANATPSSSGALGFYKFAYNEQGHISSVASPTSTDLTGLGVLTPVNPVAGSITPQAPTFGGTFAIPSINQYTNAQIALSSAYVTIPNTLVSTVTRGLMSTEDKTRLDGLSHIHNERILLASANSASPSSIIFSGVATGTLKTRIVHIYNYSGDHALGLLTWGTLSNSNVVFNYTFIGGNQLFMGSGASHVPGSSGTGLYFNKNSSGGLQIFNHTGSSIFVDFYGMNGTKFDEPITTNNSTAYIYN